MNFVETDYSYAPVTLFCYEKNVETDGPSSPPRRPSHSVYFEPSFFPPPNHDPNHPLFWLFASCSLTNST